MPKGIRVGSARLKLSKGIRKAVRKKVTNRNEAYKEELFKRSRVKLPRENFTTHDEKLILANGLEYALRELTKLHRDARSRNPRYARIMEKTKKELLSSVFDHIQRIRNHEDSISLTQEHVLREVELALKQRDWDQVERLVFTHCCLLKFGVEK